MFFHGYDSYADWAQGSSGATTDPTLASTLARTTAADGDLLSSKDYTVWAKRDDLSLDPGFRAGTRVEVIIEYVVRPGHGQEFEDLVKLYTEGYKGVSGMHWGTYEEIYGPPGNAFLVIITHKSAAELDAEDDNDKKFVENLGPRRAEKTSAAGGLLSGIETNGSILHRPQDELPNRENARSRSRVLEAIANCDSVESGKNTVARVRARQAAASSPIHR